MEAAVVDFLASLQLLAVAAVVVVVVAAAVVTVTLTSAKTSSEIRAVARVEWE